MVSLQVLVNESHVKRPLQEEIVALSKQNGTLSDKQEHLRQANAALSSSNDSLKKANGALTSENDLLWKASGDLHKWNAALAVENRELKAKMAAVEQAQGKLISNSHRHQCNL